MDRSGATIRLYFDPSQPGSFDGLAAAERYLNADVRSWLIRQDARANGTITELYGILLPHFDDPTNKKTNIGIYVNNKYRFRRSMVNNTRSSLLKVLM